MPPLKKTLIAGLLAIVALAIAIAVTIFFIHSPSPVEHAAFARWQASQYQHVWDAQASRNTIKNERSRQ